MTMTHKQGSNAEADAPLTFVIQTTTLQGMSMALRAYSTLLVGMETLVVQWLHRRREAVSDVQRMLERLPLCRNIGEVWHVQREWMHGAGQRLLADAFGTVGSAPTRTTTKPPAYTPIASGRETAVSANAAERCMQVSLHNTTAIGSSGHRASRSGQR